MTAAMAGTISPLLLLYDSIQENNFTLLKKFVDQTKINLNDKFKEYRKANHKDLSPIHLAAYRGCREILDYLIQQGCKVNLSTTNMKRRALHYAVLNHHVPCIRLLLRYRAEINMKDAFGNTPLNYAAEDGFLDAINILIASGADVNEPDITRKSPLMKAARTGNMTAVSILLMKGAEEDAKDSNGDTALHFASRCGYLGVVNELLKRRARVDPTNKWGHTPVMEAINYNQLTVFRRLLSGRCSLLCRDRKTGDNCLHLAMRKNYLSIVDTLLSQRQARTLMGQLTLDGETPAGTAICSNRIEVVLLLIYHNYDFAGTARVTRDYTRLAALQVAVAKSYWFLVLLLAYVTCTPYNVPPTYLMNDDLNDIQEEVCGVASLQRLSRRAARARVPMAGFQTHVQCLPVPAKLQKYLNMAELFANPCIKTFLFHQD